MTYTLKFQLCMQHSSQRQVSHVTLVCMIINYAYICIYNYYEACTILCEGLAAAFLFPLYFAFSWASCFICIYVDPLYKHHRRHWLYYIYITFTVHAWTIKLSAWCCLTLTQNYLAPTSSSSSTSAVYLEFTLTLEGTVACHLLACPSPAAHVANTQLVASAFLLFRCLRLVCI